MFRISMTLARFALSAWAGAAALFVVTGVREVRSPALNSTVRDLLVGIRFPAYYFFGFALVGAGLISTLAAGCSAPQKRGRLFGLAGIVALALALMIGDYICIYQPLLEMIIPPGESRPAAFADYHKASKWINSASIMLCAVAALILCAQRPPSKSE